MPTLKQHEFSFYSNKSPIGIVAFSPHRRFLQGVKNPVERGNEYFLLLLATGNQEPGKLFFTNSHIREYIIHHNLPPLHFGYVNVKIRHDPDQKKKMEIHFDKLQIRDPRFQGLLTRADFRHNIKVIIEKGVPYKKSEEKEPTKKNPPRLLTQQQLQERILNSKPNQKIGHKKKTKDGKFTQYTRIIGKKIRRFFR